MKKVTNILVIAVVILMLTACNSNESVSTVKNGTYVFEQAGTEVLVSPSVTISNKEISFTYDALSSYYAVGAYTINGDLLTMSTNDGEYKYVFLIDGDSLIFRKDESSDVGLINEKFGSKIKNNAEFKLRNE